MKPELIAVDYAVYGHEVTKQSHLDTAIERRGIITLPYRLGRYLQVLKILYKGHRMATRGLEQRFREPFFDQEALESLDKKALYDLITERCGFDYIYVSHQITFPFQLCKFSFYNFQSIRNHLIASESSSTLCIIVFIIAANGKQTWDADFCCDLAELMISSDDLNVESAGVPTELRSLAMQIFQCGNHQDFLDKSAVEADSWLRTEPRVCEKYRQFLKMFGHRCLREFDMTSHPWEEDSTPLVETLQSMVLSMQTQTQMAGPSALAFRSLSLDERLAKLSTPLDGKILKRLKFVLPYVYRAVALRETCKSMIIKRGHEIRLAYRKLATKLCGEGRLPHPDLIFHLSHYELGQLLDTRSPTLLQKYHIYLLNKI